MKLFLTVVAALWLTATIVPVQAQTVLGPPGTVSSDSDKQQTSEQEVRELLRLLSKPELVEKLKERLPETADGPDERALTVSGLQKYLQAALVRIEVRVQDIVQAAKAVPELSNAIAAAWHERMAADDFLQSPIYVIIFLFGGFGLEWLYWSYMSGSLKRIELSKPKTYGSILKAAVLRAALLFGSIAVFAVGSIGLFVSFTWSPFIADIVLSLLAGIISIRVIIMLAVFVLAPKVDDLRLLPLDQTAAHNIYAWTIGVSSVGLLGYLFVDTLVRLAIAPASLLAIEVMAGAVFAFVSIGAFWQSDSLGRKQSVLNGVDVGADGSATAGTLMAAPSNFTTVLWSALVLVVFVLWLLQMSASMWTLVTLAILFSAIQLSHIMVEHIFDHVEDPTPDPKISDDRDDRDVDPDAKPRAAPPSRYDFYRPLADRLIRFILVIIAVLTLGLVWDVTSMLDSASSSFAQKIFGLVVDVVFAFLIAELLWTAIKTAIDQKLATIDPPVPGHVPGPEARIATLLPMIRKILMVTILVMVVLIILSSIGINIGPILAGAGVVGIALGFGAQALVKDIVSGVFFLIDDAFRVGEYIETGNLRGTVESVSIRSLRVRHHRGALHTIPFGELKSLTNYSRDWVIMKLEFRVPFDTDIQLVKKIIKKVSAKLKANEDYGHHFIEPLKSQGVRRMEEFNMVIGVKFMTVPGEQWTIRRDAYQQIRDAFEANGIHFATRNVKVEVISDRPLTKEEEEAAVSAAQESVEHQLPAKPAPDEP